MPTGLADGASAPWTAADFAQSTTSVTFALAIVAFVRAMVIVRNERGRRTAEVGSDDSPAVVSVVNV
jgi:hypothetical protein